MNRFPDTPFLHRLCTLLVALTTSLTALASTAAEGNTGTLNKVAGTGMMTIGFHDSTPPFTFVGSDGTVMGYSYDIALKIADAVKRELKLPKLQIKQVAYTTQNRFAIVQNGTADLSCGATTHTREREKISAFSNTLFIAGSRLMTRKDSGIKDFSDLAGKNVVTFDLGENVEQDEPRAKFAHQPHLDVRSRRNAVVGVAGRASGRLHDGRYSALCHAP